MGLLGSIKRMRPLKRRRSGDIRGSAPNHSSSSVRVVILWSVSSENFRFSGVFQIGRVDEVEKEG